MTDQQTQIDWQARAEAADRQVREARGLLEVCINRLTQLCRKPCACTDKVECTTHAIANRVATYLTTPAPSPAQATEVERLHIVFDGPPSPESGRFVEVENDAGESVNAGEWLHRKDGLWELIIAGVLPTPPAAQVAEQVNAPAECGKDGE